MWHFGVYKNHLQSISVEFQYSKRVRLKFDNMYGSDYFPTINMGVRKVKDSKRISFTTAYWGNELFDYFGIFTRSNLKIALTNFRTIHPGLRFIKQNLPQIEILEFSSWEEFTREVSRGWDIVGFSFFTHETNEILQMAEYARKAGIKELWAGNYGYDLFNSEEYVLKLISKRIHWMKDQGGLSSVHDFLLSSISTRLHGSVGSPQFFS